MTETEAIEIAARHAKQQGWTWLEPVECKLNKRWFSQPVYVIRTNTGNRGCNILMMIDATEGTVTEARFLPR